jgi:outer membrane protein TolC
VWNIVGNVLQPIFQGGRLRANVDLSRSRADVALARYGLSVLGAFAEVEHTLIREQYLSEREAALAVATEQSLAARTLAEDQYNSGLRGFVTLLESQRSAYDNESLLLTVRRERLDARIDLHLALGGDFVTAEKPQMSDAGVEP